MIQLTDADLYLFGYADGWYTGTCRDCQMRWDCQAKGSWRCKECAAKAFETQSKPNRAGQALDLEAIEKACCILAPGELSTVESMAITALIARIRELEAKANSGLFVVNFKCGDHGPQQPIPACPKCFPSLSEDPAPAALVLGGEASTIPPNQVPPLASQSNVGTPTVNGADEVNFYAPSMEILREFFHKGDIGGLSGRAWDSARDAFGELADALPPNPKGREQEEKP